MDVIQLIELIFVVLAFSFSYLTWYLSNRQKTKDSITSELDQLYKLTQLHNLGVDNTTDTLKASVSLAITRSYLPITAFYIISTSAKLQDSKNDKYLIYSALGGVLEDIFDADICKLQKRIRFEKKKARKVRLLNKETIKMIDKYYILSSKIT